MRAETDRPPIGYRLFFAVRPPRGPAREIGRLRDRVGGGGRVADDRLHVTLWLSDDYDQRPRDLGAVLAAAVEPERLTSARVILDRLICGDHSALLAASEPVLGMERLRTGLAHALRRRGCLARPGWRYGTHVTLSYRNPPAPSRDVDPISWTATELLLIESAVGARRHRPIARWRLRR